MMPFMAPMMMGKGGVSYIETSQSLPAMTGNSSPNGHVALANSEYNGDYAAWKAFDGVLSGDNRWLAAAAGVPAWIQRKVPTAIRVGAYTVTGGTNNSPDNFTLYGSNDGTNWVDLDGRTAQSGGLGPNISKTFTISPDKRGSYLYHRLTITAVAAGSNNFGCVADLALLQEIFS